MLYYILYLFLIYTIYKYNYIVYLCFLRNKMKKQLTNKLNDDINDKYKDL